MEKCAINTEFAAHINDVRVITLWRKVDGVYKEAFD